jgi:hypothetical protein
VAAGLALAVERALLARSPIERSRWERTNHRGAVVSLVSGPALALAATLTSNSPLRASTVAGLGAAAVGAYDDVAGSRLAQQRDKGLRGHAAALRAGRISAGAVKVVGIAVAALLAARLTGRRPATLDVLADGALVAVAANLLNLLDLRPGRALKVGLLAAVALDEMGPAGATLALLPGDLRERTMLGDAGANSLGAVLGLALVRRVPSRPGRLTALAAGVGLTLASEVVSYSRVIEAVPPLRALDRLGRRP